MAFIPEMPDRERMPPFVVNELGFPPDGDNLLWQFGEVEDAEAAFQVAIDSSDAEQAQLARQNLAAMRQLTAARRRGDRHDIVEDAKDLSVGRGKGSQKWRRWVRRDPS